ncbi:hypothetical protein ANN_04079 [Periplaneta americana]|uniref:Uncharacterized protein n=1 Tax=Periplaneta americana TaxID=6978 RepID=A0ABQ8T8B1_PERAM|nr:hypothetical protein ANN_04079 [Periplaneta americana]
MSCCYFFGSFQSMGPWCSEAKLLTSDIGKYLSALNGDSRSTAFLRQRISIAIQRGNADRRSLPVDNPQLPQIDDICSQITSAFVSTRDKAVNSSGLHVWYGFPSDLIGAFFFEDTVTDEWIEEEDNNDNDNFDYPKSEDQLLVKFPTKKTIKFYVGCIEELVPGEELRFVRNCDGFQFKYPEVEDVSLIDYVQVVVITEDVQNAHLLLGYRPHIDVSLTCEHDSKLQEYCVCPQNMPQLDSEGIPNQAPETNKPMILNGPTSRNREGSDQVSVEAKHLGHLYLSIDQETFDPSTGEPYD